jgi:ferredoxin--NADP+ reductase
MGYLLLESRWLCQNVRWLRVRAPQVTRNYRPGQFVIVRPEPNGERIPLTIAHCDAEQETILLIVQVVGATTRALCSLEAGQSICDLAGPLGHPTDIRNVGHAVVVGGGVGTAVIYPQAPPLRKAGNRVTAIIGARTRSMLILEDQLKDVCDEVLPCTDDKSYGFGGFVTQRLQQLIDEAEVKPGLVLCAGPVPMMRAVAEVTRAHAIPTIASLNPIMVDGTGMCGGCRVHAGGQVKFACVDGPEFDAHTVDFKELADRLVAYREHEQRAACRSGMRSGM